LSNLEILTFGCRLNLWESEAMRGLAQDAGLEQAIIVNSCAVTAEAERQTRQAIRRAGRARPGVPIIVTGCAAQLNPSAYAAMPEVSRVLGNGEKLDPAAWRDPAPMLVSDAATLTETAGHLIDGFAENTRGFVQVQQGCDHRCTFCIIPYARGPSRSVPLGTLVKTIEHLLDHGHREIVLTGVDLTSWGGDLPGKPQFSQLLRRLLAQLPQLERLRLSSLDPAELDADFWHLFGDEPRLMPHLHISAQAGDDLVLKQMKRRHSRVQILEMARLAREKRPDVALGADLIAGFPTETDVQFEQTLHLITEAGLHYLHVFPYSPREGTPAARLKRLNGDVVKARAAALRAAGAVQLERRLSSLIGRTARVLMEQGGIGRTPCFAPVRPDRPADAGDIVTLRLTAQAGDHLQGEAA
jgi:threonylcarbamoyladenosine tRNA methylthiotransferase MtaB